jgi:carboxyl-terminal processing protease
MRPRLFALTLCSFPCIARGQSYQPIDVSKVQLVNDLYAEADSASTAHHYAKAGDLYAQAIGAGFELAELAYAAASSYALAGDKDRAFAYLGRALELGLATPDQVKSDSGLATLHGDPRWEPLLHRVAQNQQDAAEQATKIWNAPAIGSPVEPRLTDAEKIAGLSEFWSEVKYNFVFPERLAHLQWDSLYLQYIPRVLATSSTYDYYHVLAELCARLGDSHTNVYPTSELLGSVGMHTRLVDGRLVVLDVWDPELRALGIATGMEIIDIDGQPFREFAARQVAPFQSASTPQDLAVRTFEYFLFLGQPDQPVEVTVQDAKGRRITRTLRRKAFSALGGLRPKPAAFALKRLPGNIAYVTLGTFEDNTAADRFLAAFDSIAKSRALILDLRDNGGGNSSVGFTILATLIDKPVPIAFWQTRDYKPVFRAWDRPITMMSAPGGDLPPDSAHHFSGPVVVLTSPRTFSAAEDFLVAFDQSGRGTIVGEPSAGSTGQPLSFKLPGGGSGRVVTWRGTYASGKPFLGIGVRPQILVSPTLRDVQTGGDTVLAIAITTARYLSSRSP